MRSFENDKPENHRVIIKKKKIFFKIYKSNRSKNLSDPTTVKKFSRLEYHNFFFYFYLRKVNYIIKNEVIKTSY